MKNCITTLYITTLLLLLSCSVSHAQESYTDTLRTLSGRDSVYVKVIRDTIWMDKDEEVPPQDVIITKGRGRFDRGILNYRFIPKGKWIGGLKASYVNFDSSDSNLLFSLLKNFDCHAKTLSVKPYLGYAIRNNIVVGVKFGYNYTLGQLDNLSLQVDDIDFSLHDLRYTEDTYSFALFHRSFVGLDNDRRFGVFNETYVGYNNGTSRFSRLYEEEQRVTDAKVHELTVGINPGICVFIMENVSAEISFGVAGFKYRFEKQVNELGEIGRSRNSGANFKINILNINIGITACF